MKIELSFSDSRWRCPECQVWNRVHSNRKGISKCRRCKIKVYVETSSQIMTYHIPKIDLIRKLKK